MGNGNRRISGKPFDIILDKCNKDKCKLFRIMKDCLDFRILKIIKNCDQKINEEIYNIIQTMQVFGLHSHGKYYFYLLFYN